MAKAAKESKHSLAKKASSKAVVEIPWREESQAIDIRDSDIRPCDVLLMVESEETCTDIIYSCCRGSKLKPLAPVKLFTYGDLEMDVLECVEGKATKERLFTEASTEAATFLGQGNPIPNELLAHLIKLKIIQVVLEDIKLEQEEVFIKMAKENEYKKMFESSTPAGDDKKKKSKEKPAKAEKTKGDDKKKKKGTESDTGSKIAVNPAKPYSQFSKSMEHPEIQVEPKQVYVILAGFYSTDLISELVKVGVPLCCLLEVSFAQSALFREDFCESTTTSSHDVSASQTEDTVETESCIDTIGAGDEDEVAHIPSAYAQVTAEEPPLCKQKPETYKSFWTGVIQLMHVEEQHDYLENIFHMCYKLTEYIPPEMTEDMVEACDDICEKQYEDLTKYVVEIETLKRQYANYLRNLRLQKISCPPVELDPKCLRIYNKLMNKFPPDCFSIPLLMACLVEEVCSGIPEDQSDHSLNGKQFENPLESYISDTKLETELHGGVRSQVINVLDSYKKRHDPLQMCNNNKPQFRCYTCKYDPKIDFKIDSRCFMVHANNELQIVMNCYKKLSKDLYAINMNGLKKCKAAILRSRHSVGVVLEKLMNEYNLQSWRTALGLTKDELCDAIHTFLLTKMKDKEESNVEASQEQGFPRVTDDMLHDRYKIGIVTQPCHFHEPDSDFGGQLSVGMLYRNFSKNTSQIAFSSSLSEYCYKEFLPGPVLLQELLKADSEHHCIEQLYSPLTDTLLLLFHNDLDEFGCGNVLRKDFLRTPVCIRDFCEYVLKTEKQWIEDQEFYYQMEYRQEVEKLKQKKEELRKALYSEFIPDEFYFILPDSIKAKLLAQEEKVQEKTSDKKQGGKADKKEKKQTPVKKDKSATDSSKKKSETQLDIEDVLRKMPEEPPKKRLSFHCANENEPYSFIAYDLGRAHVQVNGWTSIFHSIDGIQVVADRTCWLGKSANVCLKLKSNNHSFIFHYQPDLVAKESFMFHSILSDGSCLVFSKPKKFRKVEEVICERICDSQANKPRFLDDDTAYRPKPQEIYFVSEKQDCVVKSFKIPFSTERNLVLSENLLMPFLDSLDKFSIRAHISVPPETLRERQKRRHNLRNRISTSATVTKTSLSHYATANRKRRASESRSPAVEKYAPKVIVHRSPKLSLQEVESDDFLQHSEVEKLKFLPETQEIKKRREALRALKETLEKHVPLFKICSSRLHKFTYVKRVKSYVSIPFGSVMKRILYKPAYYKRKRTIEIKRCLSLGCANVPKIRKPAYNIRLSLPSGLIIRDIPGVASEFPCIRQHYIDKGPQCKDIVHEESRTFLRNGNIAIKKCDGNIDVLSANGRIFHFEVPYVMKTKTERMNYRDSNLAKLQKRRSPTIPIHAANRSLTTFQKLLHRVLPRRFKHMIDSKESRYYLSRRAYMREQKKHCTNVNMLYLLETQRQPFPEYTVVTPDGKKIKISKSKVYEEHKFYVATDNDYRLEETLFEREDGTCCILNREGVLTTQFPDGTRLTTWFVESNSQIFADDIEDAYTKDEFIQTDEPPNADRSRMNTVYRFAVEIPEGWVSIYMYYEYSHPNYATVIFGGEDSEMTVILPNGCKVTSKEGEKTTVTVGKFLETEFDKSRFYMKTRGCPNCANCAHAVVEMAPLYHGKQPKVASNTFLHVRDSVEKHFRVDYDGKCSRNTLEKTKADTDCPRHSMPTLEKLFSVKGDFSGCAFWNRANYKSFMAFAEKNESFTIDNYSKDGDDTAVVDFREYICKPFHERYICKYDEPTLKLSKYKTRQPKVFANPAYILQNVLRKVVSVNKIEPLYKCILENCEKYGLRKKYENFESFYTHVTQQLPEINRSLGNEENECLDPCPCTADKEQKEQVDDSEVLEEEEEMKLVQAAHDKWYKWQEECKKYKQLVKENYVPLYFKSKFGKEFTDRSGEGQYSSSVKRMAGAETDELEERSAEISRIFSTASKLSREALIEVDKKKTAERKAGAKVVKEELHISIPKDMVLLYNQGKGSRTLDMTEKQITARSESTGQDFEDRPEKMLVLAGVRDKSKVEIASKFLELHGASRKYETESKIVLIADENKPKLKQKYAVESEAVPTEKDENTLVKASSLRSSSEIRKQASQRAHFSDSSKRSVVEEATAADIAVDTNQPEEQNPEPEPEPAILEEQRLSVTSEESTQTPAMVTTEEPPLIDDAVVEDVTSNKSATDVLKNVVRMSKQLLKETSIERIPSVEDPDVAYPDATRSKVNSVLSDVMNMIIGDLSNCPEKITPRMSNSIGLSAYKHVHDANLSKTEMQLFVKALDDMVEEACAHVNPTSSSLSSDSDMEVVIQSKLIPVKNIGDVFNSYNSSKRAAEQNKKKSVADSPTSKAVYTRRPSVITFDEKGTSHAPATGVGTFVEGDDTDSDITVSFENVEITDSMVGFTSKYNFHRTPSEEKKSTTVFKPDTREHTRSSMDMASAVKRRRSSASASRVRFDKEGAEDRRASLKVIHQSDLLPVPSITERMHMSSFIRKSMTGSMFPLYGSSICMGEPGSFVRSSTFIFEEADFAAAKTQRPLGRFAVSEGTQTYKGKDVNIQTSDELLTGRRGNETKL